MTPEEYAAQALIYFLVANGRVPEADHSLFESAVTHYVRAAVEAERDRCAQIALALGWREDTSDAMQIAATSIACAIRNP